MLYKLSFLALLLFSSVQGSSQLHYTKILDDLYQALKATPSYKGQIKGVRKKEFEELYLKLKADSANIHNHYEAYNSLVELFFQLRDNHLGFMLVPDGKYYPSSSMNMDSLESILKVADPSSLEGIYYYDTLLKVGIYKRGDGNFEGLVLQTKFNSWKRGEVALQIRKDHIGVYRAIYAHPRYKTWSLYNNEKYFEGALLSSYFHSTGSNEIYRKAGTAYKSEKDQLFIFKALNSAFNYLRIPHFSANSNAWKESKKFIDRIKDSLTSANLIIDLRDNTGGAHKVSEDFFDLFKKFARKGKIHVLVNYGTISQGEIFALELKQLPSVTIYGQQTSGTLTYGSNFGKWIKLSEPRFMVYPTDMDGHRALLPYEGIGVKPDVELKGGDWIAQILSIK